MQIYYLKIVKIYNVAVKNFPWPCQVSREWHTPLFPSLWNRSKLNNLSKPVVSSIHACL